MFFLDTTIYHFIVQAGGRRSKESLLWHIAGWLVGNWDSKSNFVIQIALELMYIFYGIILYKTV
jgi:hypothetical protein